jgi:hypothetical protein
MATVLQRPSTELWACPKTQLLQDIHPFDTRAASSVRTSSERAGYDPSPMGVFCRAPSSAGCVRSWMICCFLEPCVFMRGTWSILKNYMYVVQHVRQLLEGELGMQSATRQRIISSHVSHNAEVKRGQSHNHLLTM